ncbi:MAG TPA: YjjG family noncanonical pyrimidine nucleotidase [Chitinophagaceae bacterium]|nr:YjjG family noncanonical pyrimidine nucleotidase [Chitinophagaceae bacterium]
MKYSHIFFDLDHTLWDFETNSRETLMDLYEEFRLEEKGIPVFEKFHERYRYHNGIFWERFRKGYISRDLLRWKRMYVTLVDFRIADEPLSRTMSVRFLDLLPQKKHLFENAIEVLDYLREKRYPIHLITNGFMETQERKLIHSGIKDYFTHVITSEEAGYLKPAREIFDFALRRVHVSASETVMIGDHFEVDIQGAMDAGMDQIYFNPAVPVKGRYPTHTINGLKDLMNLF